MALVANTQTTYSTVGNREDLTNDIYRIDPTDTPFYTMAKKVKATAVTHEWQTQALAAPNTSNAALEGDEATVVAATPTVRLGNICQISLKTGGVTGTQQKVNHAGVPGKELDYQKMLKGMELKRDIDAILCGSNQAKVTGNATTARTVASVLSWLKTNTSKGGGSGADPSAADGTATRTDGTQRAFSEPMLKTVLASAWTNGGKPNTIMTNSFNKQAFSTFVGRATPMEDTKSKKIIASVDAYESDFGLLKVVPSRQMRQRDVLILQSDMWAVANLRGFESYPLAKTGDSDKFQIVSEYTLEARNEKSSGGVFDLTTS